jgi:hypothetical protein
VLALIAFHFEASLLLRHGKYHREFIPFRPIGIDSMAVALNANLIQFARQCRG